MITFDAMVKLAEQRKVSRRDFVQFALSVGVTLTVAQTAFSRAARATPKRGGSARLGLAQGATTDTIDPAGYPDTGTAVPFWGSMSNGLTEVDAQGNIVADLVKSMEPANGAKTWVFKLLDGVTFHNGKTLTADDVVASYRYHMGEGTKSAAKALLKTVTDIKADGPGTVVFSLSGGYAEFPYLCSDTHLPIMPTSADGTADWQSGARTGPFILGSYEPGQRVVMTRNPNYHKEGKPYFDEVEFISLNDVTARTNALITGEVHWIGRADLKTLSLLKSNPNIVIAENTGNAHDVFAMNVTVPPFDNVDVRTALKYAIDREDIVKRVLLGHGKPGNDNPIAPAVKFAIDPQPQFSYDPEKARFHLKKAGHTNLKVDLSVADAAFNGAIDAAVLYQQHALAAGIDLNVVREPNDGYWDNVWMKKPWSADHWGGKPTCDWMFTSVYAADAAWNETQWKHPRFNELLVAARSETDDQKRASMYAEMQQLVHDDGGAVVIAFDNYVEAHSKELAHGPIATNWEADGLKIAERWWFA